MASIYDLYIEQGSDFTKMLDTTGDYTGYTISGSYKDSNGVLVDTGFVSWIDATLGQFSITITAAMSTEMSKGIGKYNIETISSNGVVDRILQGRIYVDGEVKWAI